MILKKNISTVKRKDCRSCGNKIDDFMDFGYMPLAGAFLEKSTTIEYLFQMQISFCKHCQLVQIPNVISKEILFNSNYHYQSSVSTTLKNHFEEYALFLERILNLKNNKGYVLEFGCNDGILLEKLNIKNIRTLGVDASENVVEIAKKKGLDVICGFFNEELAISIFEQKKEKAQIVTGSNVFAHNDDIQNLINGVNSILSSDGFFIVEVHYLLPLIENLQFDFFYHEHCNYYSLQSIENLLKINNLEVIDALVLPIHGGTLRVISKKSIPNNLHEKSFNYHKLIELEKKSELNNFDTYLNFSKKIQNFKVEFFRLINNLKQENKKIICYGASGRAVTLLNYLSITNQIDYIIDDSPTRANHIFPGLNIPIYHINDIDLNETDVCIITAWSYAEEILKKLTNYLDGNRQIVIPLPQINIIK